MDQLSHEPCPFNNLKYLRIDATCVNPEDDVATMATQVRNYLLEQSPSATYIMDFPTLVPQKRSRQELPNDTMANKVAKLELEEKQPETVTEVERMLEEESQMHVAEQNTTLQLQGQLIAYQEKKIQMQAEVLAEEKAKLEAMESQLSQMQDEVIKFKIAELKVQVESGNPDYEVIHSMVLGFKSAMDLIPERSRIAMEAKFSSDYEELKSLFSTCINTGQWAQIESELGSLSQLDVHDAELLPVPSLSSAKMAASSSNVVIQPPDSSR